jgi:hypothetical protein
MCVRIEIDGRDVEMMNLETSTDVFQKYVEFAHTLKTPRNLTTAEVQFLLNAQTANHQIRLLQDDARHSGVYGRLSEQNIHKQMVTSRDTLGETDKIQIYTRIQESLQSMATLISNSEVEDIKTYTWQRHTYKMSIVINTLMHDAASNISRLSTRFDTPTAPTLHNASINSLLLRIQRLSI